MLFSTWGRLTRLERRLVLTAFMACALAVASYPLLGVAQAAPTPLTALINGDSVTTVDGITSGTTPISLEQYALQQLGYTVTVVSGTQWDAMTAAQFAAYSLLVVGDPDCSATPSSATSDASTWAPVVMGTAGGNTQAGNRAVVGTDPEYHYLSGAVPTNPANPSTSGAEHLVQAGLQFAGDGPVGTTGVYFDTSCYDNGSDVATFDMLTTTGPGHWSEDASPPCGGSVQKIASVAEFAGVSDSDIQGWECSDHITFPAFPADWNAEAVATDTTSHPTCGTDPGLGTTACGEAYVILAGKGVTSTAPNIALSPTTATNPVGASHTVTATVTTNAGAPIAGAAMTFVVSSGPNTGTTGTCTFSNATADPGCTTGADGKVLFTYSDGGGAGIDTINASVTVSGSTEHATATKTWVAAASGCAIITAPYNTTAFSSGGQSIHIENQLHSDTTKVEALVLRTLTGPAKYFRLTGVTDATCHDNTAYPTGAGNSFNTLTVNGTGLFGTDYSHNASGYKIHVEASDRGDGVTDVTTVDTVNFQITTTGGTLVWSGTGTLASGGEEETG